MRFQKILFVKTDLDLCCISFEIILHKIREPESTKIAGRNEDDMIYQKIMLIAMLRY